MIVSAATPVIGSWLLGTLVVCACWPRRVAVGSDLALILPLGLGIGLGLSSALFFAATLVSPRPAPISAGLELAVAAVVGWRLWRWPAPTGGEGPTGVRRFPVGTALLASLFGQAGLLAIVITVRAAGREPYGSWDGWAIWNLHARFLFRAGPAWPALLNTPQLGWSHPDYPLLVPASVARMWAFAGSDAAALSALVSTLFGVGTVGLLVAATALLRGRIAALVGGLVLLGTPFFVTFASNEHADIPLSFFVLAAAVTLAISPRWPRALGLPAMAGICAGLAAWTKNEGLLLAVIAGLAWAFGHWPRRSWRPMLAYLGGLAVALLPVVYFKFAIAPANDLVSSHPADHLARLADLARHRLIWSAFWRDGVRFGEWRVAPFFVLALPLIGPFWRRLNRAEGAVAVLIGLTLAGYYGVYLLTPWDLSWHLEYSLVRLLLQLWPATIFLWALATTAPIEGVNYSGRLPGRAWKGLIALGLVNLAVAGGVLTLLNRQLPDNELAVVQAGGVKVAVIVGDGWFERETGGGETWRWSKGASTLWLDPADRNPPPFTLRFGIRSLGRRTVTARLGGRVVWHGQVGEAREEIQIGPLELPAGLTPLAFSTDEPAVLESASPGARALAFALYGVGRK